MRIIKIERLKETSEEHFTIITYKNFWGRTKVDTFITRKYNISTIYAKTGKKIDTTLWEVVDAFIRTGDQFHEY